MISVFFKNQGESRLRIQADAPREFYIVRKTVGSREIAIFYRKSGENGVSAVAEERKMGKIVFRPWPKNRKREKPAVVGRRNEKYSKNCPSSADESQNHSFSAFPTPWKARITQFLRFQPLGKSESLIFCISNPLESQKTGKNRLSSTDDERKTANSGFHPRMTGEKLQFPGFIHG